MKKPISRDRKFSQINDFSSTLGATLQYSGWDEENKCVVENPDGIHVKLISGIHLLDNHTVNLLSSLITAMLTPYLAQKIFS